MKTTRLRAPSSRAHALTFLATLALAVCALAAAPPASSQEATAVQQTETLRVTQTREEEQLRGRVAEALSKGDAASADKLMIDAAAKKNTAALMASDAVASGSVFYEQITGCGFYPAESRLECIINIKRPFGYGGPIETRGSVEYVEFCVDWDSNGFQSTDSVGSGHVVMHDGAAGTSYAVYRDFEVPSTFRTRNQPAGTALTATPAPLLRARAILSWQLPPTGCAFSPPWGNVFPFTIRLDPIR